MTDSLVLGPDDFLILETESVDAEQAERVRVQAAEKFGVDKQRVVVFSGCHAKTLRVLGTSDFKSTLTLREQYLIDQFRETRTHDD